MYNKLFLFVGFAFVYMLSTTTARRKQGKDCKDDPLLEDECTLMRQSFGDKVCTTEYLPIKKMMSNHCRATCGLCRGNGGTNRAFAPPIPCRRSRYGCCWDRATVKHGRAGKNCPVCKDRHGRFCREFNWMCYRTKGRNDYVKLNCPVTCGTCVRSRHANEKVVSFYDIYRRAFFKLRKDHRSFGKRYRGRRLI